MKGEPTGGTIGWNFVNLPLSSPNVEVAVENRKGFNPLQMIVFE